MRRVVSYVNLTCSVVASNRGEGTVGERKPSEPPVWLWQLSDDKHTDFYCGRVARTHKPFQSHKLAIPGSTPGLRIQYRRTIVTSKNDITGDELKSRTSTDNYRNGWDRIFGKKPEPVVEEKKEEIKNKNN